MANNHPEAGQSSTTPIDLTSSPVRPSPASATIDLTESPPIRASRDDTGRATAPIRSLLEIGEAANAADASASRTILPPPRMSSSSWNSAGRYGPLPPTPPTPMVPPRPEVRTAARQHSRSSPAVPVLPTGLRPPNNTLSSRPSRSHTEHGNVRPGPNWDPDGMAMPRTLEEIMQQVESGGYRRRRGDSNNTEGNDRGMPRRTSSRSYPRAPWQSDDEATQCARCAKPFSLLNRRHHCRKCGLVVCAACSTHRIMMPRRFISQPAEYPDSGSERDDSAQGDELQTVRVCDPCVPDPNYGLPPHLAVQFGQPSYTGTRAALPPLPPIPGGARPAGITVGPQGLPPNTRRGTTSGAYPADIFYAGPPPNYRSSSIPNPHAQQHFSLPSFASGSAGPQTFASFLQRAQAQAQAQAPVQPPPPPPRRFPNMAIYKASEKDVRLSGDEDTPPECVICLCEFEVDEELALLECFCKFHKECIIGWWDKDKDASCPTHKLRE